jgi:hypothetical protein
MLEVLRAPSRYDAAPSSAAARHLIKTKSCGDFVIVTNSLGRMVDVYTDRDSMFTLPRRKGESQQERQAADRLTQLGRRLRELGIGRLLGFAKHVARDASFADLGLGEVLVFTPDNCFGLLSGGTFAVVGLAECSGTAPDSPHAPCRFLVSSRPNCPKCEKEIDNCIFVQARGGQVYLVDDLEAGTAAKRAARGFEATFPEARGLTNLN